MFAWLKKRLARWADGVMQRESDRLLEKALQLKTKILKDNGNQPIRLDPKRIKRFKEMAAHIDPEVLKRVDVIGLDDFE